MTDTKQPRVGFIGLGNMGQPMAARTAEAGFPLTVFDVRPASGAALIAVGADWADSPANLARECDIVCTSLPGPEQAEEVFLGPQGILAGVTSGTLCVDFTTNAPSLVRQLQHELSQRGSDLLDVPVSGGVEAARQGSLTMLVGGSDATLTVVRPLLRVLGETIVHVGESGTASICKILHNCAVFCANLATVECLTAGIKAGVDARTLIEVFQQSGLGRNLDLQVALPKTLFRGNFEPRFALGTARKDIGLATALARGCGVPMQLAELCERDMAAAVERGWAERDNTIFLTLQEERADVVVRTNGPKDESSRVDDQ